MTSPVISVEHLTKQYDLGVIGTGTLSRDLNRWWARVRHQPDPYTRIGQQDAFARIGETILALDDVSFQVQRGEALGIIGRNGAGKSTLLKILSRVTAPSSGVVKVKGRIGSLLEVGTGFHPELTGRENVYLNGAILGMKKAEITRRFDEIVDFAGVEKFIDTPVKRYSSGMYVRLAFAVAAHLDPEILIVDEVLAVGDAEFQKKCLGKMGDVAGEGRTVLFVSHNMAAIKKLCSTSIWLNKGFINAIGNTEHIISDYLTQSSEGTKEVRFPEGKIFQGNDKFKLLALRITSDKGDPVATLDITKPFFVEIEYQLTRNLPPMRLVFVLSTISGEDIFTSIDASDGDWIDRDREKGIYLSRCKIPGNLLQAGSYLVRVSADIPFTEVLFQSENLLSFHILQTGGVSGRYAEKWPGIICPDLDWQVTRLKDDD